ncbi:hypothetical protein D9M71_606050 [compost metagenome]
MELGRVLIICLFGRFGERPDASVNPLGNVALVVAEKQAGMVDVTRLPLSVISRYGDPCGALRS